MKLEPRGSFSVIILFLKLVWYVDNYFSFEVPAGTITAVNAKLSLSPRLEDKLTLATEEGTKLVQQFILLWRSTKTDMKISMAT